MPRNADKHAQVLSILCCARRIHVLRLGVSDNLTHDGSCKPSLIQNLYLIHSQYINVPILLVGQVAKNLGGLRALEWHPWTQRQMAANLPYRKVLKTPLPKFGAINGNPHQNLVTLCYRGVMLPHKLQLLLQIHPGPNQLTTAGSMQHEINGVGGTQGLSHGDDFPHGQYQVDVDRLYCSRRKLCPSFPDSHYTAMAFNSKSS